MSTTTTDLYLASYDAAVYTGDDHDMARAAYQAAETAFRAARQAATVALRPTRAAAIAAADAAEVSRDAARANYDDACRRCRDVHGSIR